MTRPLCDIEAELAVLERVWAAMEEDDGLGIDVSGADRDADLRVGGRSAAGRSGGNPNHDPANGQFTGGPGDSPGSVRKARRRRRLRKLLRKHRRERRQVGARQKGEKQALVARQREKRATHKAYYDKRASNLKSRQGRELQRMDASHAKELARGERKGDVDVEWLKDAQRRERETRVDWHQGERNSLRDERKEAAADLQKRQASHRKAMGRRHGEEREQIREEHTDELASHGFRRKGAVRGVHDGDVRRVADHVACVPVGGESRRFSSGRTHKASSAEAILRHCLRQLALSVPYRRGELTSEQAMELLAAIREYGRAWLHHEFESFVRVYGKAIEGPETPRAAVGLDGVRAAMEPSAGGDGLDEGGRGDDGSRALGSAMRRHVGRLFGRARQFVRELILAGAMALSGPDLDEADLAAADRATEEQVGYLNQFERDVHFRTPPELAEPSGPALSNPMTAAEFAARAEQYGTSPWSSSINAQRLKFIRSGRFTHELRVHSKPPGHHECKTCIDASLAGWQPIGTLPPIGDSECMGSCDCYFRYEDRGRAA